MDVQLFYLVFALVIKNLIRGEITCHIENVECMTSKEKYFYEFIVNGGNGWIEPLDPININHFGVILQDIQYETMDTTLRGMKNCEVTQVICNGTIYTIDYYLQCSELTLETRFFETGVISPNAHNVQFYQDDLVSITAVNHTIRIIGEIELRTNKHASVPYQFIYIKMSSISIETYATENVKFYVQNLHTDNVMQTNIVEEYFHEKWEQIDEKLFNPAIRRFVGVFIETYDVFFSNNDIKYVQIL